MSARYRRVEPLDALVVDGEAVLLLPPDQVVRLSALGTAIFNVTAGPTTVDDLAPAIEARFGAPGDGDTRTALAGVLYDLVAAGVLERVDRG